MYTLPIALALFVSIQFGHCYEVIPVGGRFVEKYKGVYYSGDKVGMKQRIANHVLCVDECLAVADCRAVNHDDQIGNCELLKFGIVRDMGNLLVQRGIMNHYHIIPVYPQFSLTQIDGYPNLRIQVYYSVAYEEGIIEQILEELKEAECVRKCYDKKRPKCKAVNFAVNRCVFLKKGIVDGLADKQDKVNGKPDYVHISIV